MPQETSKKEKKPLDSDKEYQVFLDQLTLLEKEKERILHEYKEALEKRKIELLRQFIEKGE